MLGRLARQPGRVVTTMLEHPAVALSLSSTDAELVFAPVRPDGVVDLPALEQLIRPGDRLCTIIWASNLTGAIQPVREIAELCAERGVPLHVDAVQAAAWLPLRLDELPGEVTAAIAAHKLHGPEGSRSPRGPRHRHARPGAARGRAGARAATGHRERRPGLRARGRTRPARRRLGDRRRHCSAARSLRGRLRAELPDVQIAAEGAARLPGHSLALIGDVRGETLCALLDEQGYAVAAGAACASTEVEPSGALAAMGVPRSLALGALRSTFGELQRSR